MRGCEHGAIAALTGGGMAARRAGGLSFAARWGKFFGPGGTPSPGSPHLLGAKWGATIGRRQAISGRLKRSIAEI